MGLDHVCVISLPSRQAPAAPHMDRRLPRRRAGAASSITPYRDPPPPCPPPWPPGGLSDLALAGRIKHTVCRVGF